ncbi:hypothetical protein TGAM01_v201559, partial [Trichoderma gamsii]
SLFYFLLLWKRSDLYSQFRARPLLPLLLDHLSKAAGLAPYRGKRRCQGREAENGLRDPGFWPCIKRNLVRDIWTMEDPYRDHDGGLCSLWGREKKNEEKRMTKLPY